MGAVHLFSQAIELPVFYRSHSPYGALHKATSLFSGMAHVLRQAMPGLVPQDTFQYAQGEYEGNRHLYALHASHSPKDPDIGALVIASMGWAPEFATGHTPKGSQELRVLLSGEQDCVLSAIERLEDYLTETLTFRRSGENGLDHFPMSAYSFPNEGRGWKVWREQDIPDLKPGRPKEDPPQDRVFGGVTVFN